MPKITTKQIQQINKACSNSWRLDTQYYLFHTEKRLIKHIELDEENYLQFSISYNYKNQAVLNINKFYHKKDDTFATSNGLGKQVMINDTPTKRKDIKKLINYTYLLTDTKLMEINQNTSVLNLDGIFEPSEDF